MNDSWFKSTYSGDSPNCAECRVQSDKVDLRDTKNRESGHLTFPSSEWVAALVIEK